MKFSIVIPAHNEEHRLPPVLKAYAEHFSKSLGDGVEIIVVVNGSTDRTADLAREIAKQHPQIRVVEETGRIGKGGAVILGVKAAQGEWIGFVDADGATSAEEFGRLFHRTQGSDGVIASRWKRGAQVNVPQRGLRLLSSRLFNGLIRLMLGLRYEDTQCGAKIFTAKAWRTILPDIGTTRFAFDVDVLFHLKRAGFRILEEPTVWRDVDGSKVQVLNSSVEMFLAVVRMRLLYSPFRFMVGWYDRLLARPVDFLLSDALFRHAMLLVFASLAIAVFNIGFQMVMGRALDRGEFALMTTFLAMYVILARPLSTVSTGINRACGLLEQEGRVADIRRLLLKWVAILGVASLPPLLASIFFVHPIAEFFHLDRAAPVWVTGLTLPALFLAPVFSGAVRGLQRFGWISVANIAATVGRFVFGGALVLMVYPACGWALAGHAVGLYLMVLVLLVALAPIWRAPRDVSSVRGGVPSLRLYLLQSFLIQLAAGLLMTGDVVFVKHFLPDQNEFAYAATLGRIVVFLAISVASAMFPKVVSEGTFSREHLRLYLRSQLYTSAFVAISLFVCLVVPGLLLRVLFHVEHPSAELVSLTRWMGAAMAFSTLLNVNINLLLAQRRFVALASVLFAALGYAVSAYLFHQSPMQVVWAALLANMVAFGLTTLDIVFSGTRTERVLNEK